MSKTYYCGESKNIKMAVDKINHQLSSTHPTKKVAFLIDSTQLCIRQDLISNINVADSIINNIANELTLCQR